MKKIILSVAIVAFFAIHAQAQVSIGVRGGFNLNNASILDDDGDKMYIHFGPRDSLSPGFMPGFQVGLVLDVPIGEIFAIQPGLLFTTQGARTSWTEWNRVGTGFFSRDERYRVSMRFSQIQVPINAQFRFGNDDVAFLLQAGPYLGLAVGGRVTEEIQQRQGRSEYHFGEFERVLFGDESEEFELVFRRFDLGLGFGIGVQVRRFQIGIGYNVSFVNALVQPEVERFNFRRMRWEETTGERSFRNHGLTFTVTYLFGGSRF